MIRRIRFWIEDPTLAWRLWKTDWFPYRTAEFLGKTDDGCDMKLGPWRWNRPRKLRRFRT